MRNLFAKGSPFLGELDAKQPERARTLIKEEYVYAKLYLYLSEFPDKLLAVLP